MKSMGGIFEKFLTNNAGDFRQRYLNTYGFFRQDGKEPLLVKISEVDNRVRFVDKKGVPYTLHADRPGSVGFEFLPPKSVMHNTSIGAVFSERVASRQWQRGVCDRNTKLYLLTREGYLNHPITFEILEEIYQNPFPINKSIDLFLNDKIHSFALSSSFAVSKSSVCVLGIRCADVWNVSKDRLEIKLYPEHTLWDVELRDACKKLNLTLEMVQ